MTYRVPEADQRMANVDRMRARAKAQAQLTMGVMTGAIQQGQPVAQVTGFAAKFPGKCVDCKSAITVGQYIRRAPVGYAHTVCPATAPVAAPLPANVPAPVGPDLSGLPTGTTTYAVENESGALTFLQVDRPTDEKWSGWAFVRQYLGGQGPAQRLGKQRPGVNARYEGQWARLLEKVLVDPQGAALRFATELGECSRCHADLTDEESRATGFGPTCRKAIAWLSCRPPRRHAWRVPASPGPIRTTP